MKYIGFKIEAMAIDNKGKIQTLNLTSLFCKKEYTLTKEVEEALKEIIKEK